MQPALSTDHPQTVRIHAHAIADAARGVRSPGGLLLRIEPGSVRILASGHPDTLAAPGLPDADLRLDLPDRLVLPALVNAHTHLDLTHIGPVPHEPGEGFVKWVDHIRASRRDTPEGISESVRLGVDLSLAGGSAAVGDIAGAPGGRLTDTPARVLAQSPLCGVSYLEFFGIGRTAALAAQRLTAYARDELPGLQSELTGSGVRVGLQPHAPNTVDLAVYRWAAAIAETHGLPLSTHLAETPEERQFISAATGPQRAMLERFGIWDESILDHVGRGRHPVEHLAGLLERHKVLCAHLNDAPDRAIELLAATGTPVVYCPRASVYFGAADHFGPHRYRDMLAAGVPVCLGTDSIVNLDTPDRISPLDEIRLLHRRDGTDPRALLAMSTINGAKALGLEEGRFGLSEGRIAGLLAVPAEGPDAWKSAMDADSGPEWVILSQERF